MTRKYRPHQCPNCQYMKYVSEEVITSFKGLCTQGGYVLNVWLEGESERDCKKFILVSKQSEVET